MDDINVLRTVLSEGASPTAEAQTGARLRLRNTILTGGVRRASGVPLLRRLLIGPAVGTGLVAAGVAAVVALGVGGAPAGQDPAPGAAGGAGADQLSAQDILLAAAESAGKQPATSGRYWLSQVHETSKVDLDGSSKDVSSDLTRSMWIAAGLADDSYIGYQGTDVTGGTKDTVGEWMNVTDPSANPAGTDVDSIGFGENREFSLTEARALPDSKSGLDAALKAKRDQECAAREDTPGHVDVVLACDETPAQYEVRAIANLLAVAPLSSAQRSAGYQVLAGLPGVEKSGKGEDSTGRGGIKLVWKFTQAGGDATMTMLVDEKTKQLFSYSLDSNSAGKSTYGYDVVKAEWTDATPTPPAAK